MARGLTPIIGLAVVMALALAAVFGSMSLANPAQAQGTAMVVPAAVNVCPGGAGFIPDQGVALNKSETYDFGGVFR